MDHSQQKASGSGQKKGAKPSSGYSLVVEKVIETENEMYINIISTSPSSSGECGYLAVITYPTVTIQVKKTGKEIKYTITPAASGC